MEFVVFNLFWGMQFRTCENFGESTDFYLVLSPKFSQIQKPHRHYFDCLKLLFYRFCESQNLVKKELCEAPENSPASWCKKSESKGAVVPPADFLLEADKRGSPPKSEKRQLLGTHFKRVGGSGAGGAALLRKEKNSNRIVESRLDSVDSAESQNHKVDCHADSANLLAMTNFYFLKNRRILRNKA